MLTKPHKSHDNIYADILKWCFQAGRVRGHMLSVTTVSRQPRASTPPPLSFLRYDRPTEKLSEKMARLRNGENAALWGTA